MLRCLIIDDNPTNRTIARYLLEAIGVQVVEVESATDALSLLTQGEIHFVMLDWMMPDIDGIEFLELLRESKEGQKAKIIMCTAKDGEANKQIALKAGADAFLTKPLTTESIEASIKAMGLHL